MSDTQKVNVVEREIELLARIEQLTKERDERMTMNNVQLVVSRVFDLNADVAEMKFGRISNPVELAILLVKKSLEIISNTKAEQDAQLLSDTKNAV